MSQDITIAEEATRTTSTFEEQIGNGRIQPRERDGEGAEAAVDLGDDRSVTARLEWQRTQDPALGCAALYVWLEASDTESGPWTRVPAAHGRGAYDEDEPTFDVVHYARTGGGSQTIGFVSPGRYLRARWKVAAQGPTKLEARFAITGRAVGAAAS